MQRKLLAAVTLLFVVALALATARPGGAYPLQEAAFVPSLAPTGGIVVDGTVDAAYGDPVASDSAGDGNGNANMDLLDLYIADDDEYFYFAYTVNADIAAANWGKYMLYIDTTNDGEGATSDAWGRNVVAENPHQPEFSINSYVDAAPYGAEDVQFWAWNGGWSQGANIQAAALGAGATSVIEWQVSKAALGNPSVIWAEVWNTGGGDTDNAQDTINAPAEDWNASDWSTQASLDVSTMYESDDTTIEVDGTIDAAYGAPVASDPAGDGNGNANMDLLDLYVAEDEENIYFAYSVNADLAAANWGKYMLYIDTTNDGQGATSDAWGRNVVAEAPHQPEYSINTYVDAAPYGAEDVQFWAWNGGWSQGANIEAAALGAGDDLGDRVAGEQGSARQPGHDLGGSVEHRRRRHRQRAGHHQRACRRLERVRLVHPGQPGRFHRGGRDPRPGWRRRWREPRQQHLVGRSGPR